MLGGEHLVTLAPVQALAEKYPDLHIIHFDAHADFKRRLSGRSIFSCLCTEKMLGAFWEMTGSISLESDPVTEKSFAGQEKGM